MIVQRTQEGKAIARQNADFRDSRSKKFTRVQLDHALELLQTHSYKQVERITGMRNTNPLHGLNKPNQEKFRAWLSHEDRKFLERAQAYYSKLMTNYKNLTANYTPPEGTQLPPTGNKRKSTRKKKQQTITPPKPIKRLKPTKTLKL